MTIIRFLLAPILGIVVFMFTVGGIQAIGASMYPPPAEISTLTIELTNAAANRDQAALENIQARFEVAMSATCGGMPRHLVPEMPSPTDMRAKMRDHVARMRQG